MNSALYNQTHHELVIVQDAPCAVCGVRHSTLADAAANPYGAKALETHHDLIEWAGATEIDWDKLAADHPSLPNLVALARAYHAHLAANGTFEGTLDPAIVTQFVDSDEQMEVLCLPPETSVLMADGSEQPIVAVRIGDLVIGGDGLVHRVTGTSSHEYDGDLVVIDGVAMTPDHPVLTPDGWLEARRVTTAEVVCEVRMLRSQVVPLGGVQAQVLDTVIGSISVDVVDALDAREPTTEMLFHDPAMFHALRPPLAVPHEDSYIPAGREDAAATGVALALAVREGGDAAGIGAVPTASQSRSKRLTASVAEALVGELLVRLTASDAAARRGTGEDGVDVPRANEVRAVADDAPSDDSSSAVRVWRPVREVGRRGFSGTVHDITIASARSFVADGLVVHNCDVHHRAAGQGIHMITGPVWQLQRYAAPGWNFVGKPAPRSETKP